jgi:hypothetical protein
MERKPDFGQFLENSSKKGSSRMSWTYHVCHADFRELFQLHHFWLRDNRAGSGLWWPRSHPSGDELPNRAPHLCLGSQYNRAVGNAWPVLLLPAFSLAVLPTCGLEPLLSVQVTVLDAWHEAPCDIDDHCLLELLFQSRVLRTVEIRNKRSQGIEMYFSVSV